ncbi:MAG: sugar phosphate isomerase/epimerase [Verrucomicrobiota bacterium]|jgi:sugar phosphate isomerase/epimerase
MKPERIDRRRFLQTSLLGSSAALAANLGANAFGAVTKPERDPDGGLKLGIASYTFRKFTLDQAIDMTKQAGFKYINLKDVHLPLKSTTEERQAARQKIEAAGLKLMGGGVITFRNDAAEIQHIFEYAKEAGMPVIVCSPALEALDAIEKKAREFDIVIAIHNHGPTDKTYPSPLDVFALVKDRDPLMGICMDIGHTVRIGVDPVECVDRCGDRLHDLHMKDETKAAADGKPTELGRGVIDIVGVLKALSARKFPYHIGLEYEAHADNPQPYVMECAGYLRGALAAMA